MKNFLATLVILSAVVLVQGQRDTMIIDADSSEFAIKDTDTSEPSADKGDEMQIAGGDEMEVNSAAGGTGDDPGILA